MWGPNFWGPNFSGTKFLGDQKNQGTKWVWGPTQLQPSILVYNTHTSVTMETTPLKLLFRFWAIFAGACCFFFVVSDHHSVAIYIILMFSKHAYLYANYQYCPIACMNNCMVRMFKQPAFYSYRILRDFGHAFLIFLLFFLRY